MALLPMLGSTKANDVFKAISEFLEKNAIPITNVTSLLTDGAPAMDGVRNDVIHVALIKRSCPDLLAFHCLIHNSVLCAKLDGIYHKKMQALVKVSKTTQRALSILN